MTKQVRDATSVQGGDAKAETHNALRAMVKPIPISSTTQLDALLHPAVTMKLDGIRAVILRDERGSRAVTMCGSTTLSPRPYAAGHTHLDAECVGEHFYIFDALWVNGRCLEAFGLRLRLQAAAQSLAEEPLHQCVMKRYEPNYNDEGTCSSSADLLKTAMRRIVSKTGRLADGALVERPEGLIFVDRLADYWTAPLKFKFTITSDFALVSRLEGLRTPDTETWSLATTCKGQLCSFDGRKYDVQSTIALPTASSFQAGEVIEAALLGASWRYVRRRADRRLPNKVAVVLENIQLTRRPFDLNRIARDLSRPLNAEYWRSFLEACARQVKVHCQVVFDLPDLAVAVLPQTVMELELQDEDVGLLLIAPCMNFELEDAHVCHHQNFLRPDGISQYAAERNWSMFELTRGLLSEDTRIYPRLTPDMTALLHQLRPFLALHASQLPVDRAALHCRKLCWRSTGLEARREMDCTKPYGCSSSAMLL